MINSKTSSNYLDDLPAIYRQETAEGHPDFLGRFLLAFEHVLTGVGELDQPGLEEKLEGIIAANGDVEMEGAHRYFTPRAENALAQAPKEFLEWLSGWVALTLRDDWTEDERRRILAEIVPSYRQRGTPGGLRQVLSAFTGVLSSAIDIDERDERFQVGRTSTVGRSTRIGSGRPHYFMISVPVPSSANPVRMRAALQAIIDLEKPAHTYYDLFVQTPTMRIGRSSRIGVSTILGVPILTP